MNIVMYRFFINVFSNKLSKNYSGTNKNVFNFGKGDIFIFIESMYVVFIVCIQYGITKMWVKFRRAGHATTLPGQRDPVFRPNKCCSFPYGYIRCGYSINTPESFVVVAKAKQVVTCPCV